MSMDKSAIEQIQQSQSIEAASNAIAAAMDRGHHPLVAIPDNMEYRDLEKYLPGRIRFRGHMNTSVISDFVRYVKDNGKAGTTCFINPEKMRARVVFDLGTQAEPGHADFTSSLDLTRGSEFSQLLSVDGDMSSQKTMAEWFEDWHEFMTFYDSEGNIVAPKTAIAATRRMTVESHRKEDHEEGNFRASKSALESIEARSEHGMPHGFRFTCIPYKGLEEHSFECRIAINTGGDKPTFTIRIKQLDLELERISEQFMEKLDGMLEGATVDIYRGEFKA